MGWMEIRMLDRHSHMDVVLGSYAPIPDVTNQYLSPGREKGGDITEYVNERGHKNAPTYEQKIKIVSLKQNNTIIMRRKCIEAKCIGCKHPPKPKILKPLECNLKKKWHSKKILQKNTKMF